MRPNSDPDRQEKGGKVSFIEAARRKQIVDTSIRTIATRGYSRTSLAEIAREAGISKGVISYHFDGKDALVEAVLLRLLKEPAEFIKKKVDRCERAVDKLQAYISANFEFMERHRDNYVALVDLWGSREGPAGTTTFNAEAYEPSRKYLMRILEDGQKTGAFRSLPLRTMASVIQGSIDGVAMQWVFDEDSIDLETSCAEIVQMITRHVR